MTDLKYRMYLDEVGNPDLGSSDNFNHRFLSLTGVILDLDYVRHTVHPQMEELKADFFGSHPDDPLILHRKELVNQAAPFHSLKADEHRRRFDDRLLELLEGWQYTVVTVCLDKKRHRDTYTTWRYDPYHYCLALILERYVFFLERRRMHGDVLAESRGGREDRRLKDSFLRLWQSGTDYVSQERFQQVLTSRELKVKPKKNNVAGLQLADLLAHPSRNEILRDHEFLSRAAAPFAQRIVEILALKYDRAGDRVFGKKMI